MNKKPLKKYQIINLLKKVSKIKLGNEKIKVSSSMGRFVSNNIFTNINLPPFNNSAVDGYAIHDNNLNDSIILLSSKKITAGYNKNISLKKNEAIRIFTGARMPSNSMTVVMQENVTINGNKIIINKSPKKGENCRRAGEDVKIGDKVLNLGEKINSQNINLIAAIGKKYINVKKKLKVGYFTSGNEVIEPREKLRNSEINNSNRYSLNSLISDQYIQSKYLGNLKDSKSKIYHSIMKHINKYHVLITTGGASVGEEDHLINFVKDNGKVFFWKIAIKPGRPLAFGIVKNTFIICLPGNPVSVHLLYGMLIKPFLELLCSSKMILPKGIKTKINFSMKKKTNRMEWLRVKIDRNKKFLSVNKFPKQGSGMISSIAYSDGIIEIPEPVKQVKKGDVFNFYLFNEIFN